MDNWDDVVERALNKYEQVVIAKLDATQAMRAAGRVFVDAALEEAAKAAEDWKRDYVLEDCCDAAQEAACLSVAAAIRALKDKLPW